MCFQLEVVAYKAKYIIFLRHHCGFSGSYFVKILGHTNRLMVLVVVGFAQEKIDNKQMIRQRSSFILRDCSTVNACVVAHDTYARLISYLPRWAGKNIVCERIRLWTKIIDT